MTEDAISRAIRLALLDAGTAHTSLRDDVEKILSFVADVQSVDTSLSAGSVGVENVFRDDAVTVKPGSFRDAMLSQAPVRHKNWFVSKKIL